MGDNGQSAVTGLSVGACITDVRIVEVMQSDNGIFGLVQQKLNQACIVESGVCTDWKTCRAVG